MRLLLTTAACALALALPQVAAAAGTVTKTGTSIVWTGTGADVVTIQPADGGFVRFVDPAGTTPGEGCTAVDPPDPTTAQCSFVAGDTLTAVAGEEDDSVTCSDLPCTLDGGPGNDTLTGLEGAQTLDGGSGNDVMTAGAGTDTVDYSDRTADLTVDVNTPAGDGESGETDDVASDVERVIGGSGNDTLTARVVEGGAGNDVFPDIAGAQQVFVGGDDVDTATYAGADADLVVSLDGEPNDGPDDDDVGTDVENVVGGLGDDEIAGSDGPNRLEGGAGDDGLDGGDGNDVVDGGDGNDRLGGGGGADAVAGRAGADKLDGGVGPDSLSGGDGAFDEATYAGRTDGVSVVIGGGPVSGNEDDGPAGARDVLDVERVVGGDGPDRLSGVGGNHGFEGGPGDDAIASRDGDVDTAFCGSGNDSAVVDPMDFVDETQCEVVDRGFAPPPPGNPPPGSPPPGSPPPGSPPPAPPSPPAGPSRVAVAAVRGQTLRGFLARGLRVRVTCPRACRATLRILVSRRTARRRGLDSAVIARGSARLTGPGRVTAVVKTSRRARRRLRTLRRLPVTVEARVTPTGRQTRLHSFELTLRRGRLLD